MQLRTWRCSSCRRATWSLWSWTTVCGGCMQHAACNAVQCGHMPPGGPLCFVTKLTDDQQWCQCHWYLQQGWCSHLTAVAMHQGMGSSAIQLLQQAASPAGHSLLLVAQQLDRSEPSEEPLEAAGVPEEAQGALQQVLVQRGAGRRAFTAEQQQAVALLNRLSRHATALTAQECSRLVPVLAEIDAAVMGRSKFQKRADGGRRDVGLVQRPTPRVYKENGGKFAQSRAKMGEGKQEKGWPVQAGCRGWRGWQGPELQGWAEEAAAGAGGLGAAV